MAIDTAAKRFSILNFGGLPYYQALIIPDGTIAAADRQHFLMGYSGIAWDAPAALGQIDGAANKVLAAQYEVLAVRGDGVNWHLIHLGAP